MNGRRLPTRAPEYEDLSGTRDEVLVGRALIDPADFRLLFDRYWDAVYRYCLYRLDHAEDAEDAASHIFLKIYRELPHFSSLLGSFRSWLFSITHNEVANWRRHRARHPVGSLDLAESVADSAPDPEERAIHSIEMAEVREVLARLSEQSRRVVELRLAGLQDTEIAVVLGTSHAAVRKAQSRAISQLRVAMGVVMTGREVSGE